MFLYLLIFFVLWPFLVSAECKEGRHQVHNQPLLEFWDPVTVFWSVHWLRLQGGAWKGWIVMVSLTSAVFLALGGRTSPLRRELLQTADLFLIPKPSSSKGAHGATLPVPWVTNVIKVQILPQDVSKVKGTHRLLRNWIGIQALPATRIHVHVTSTHGSNLGVLDSLKHLLFLLS